MPAIPLALRSLALAAVVAAATAVPAGPAGAARKLPPGDPPGNNGTIKVVASDPSDPDPGNEPQIDGCLLWVEFYGFDQGQTADIAFTAQPPTGDRQLLTDVATISDDPAGGGQDDDEVIGYNLTTALAGLEPHPQRGYHVKLTSNTREAPGGAKQKVFWLNCTPEPAGSLLVRKAVEGQRAGPFAFDVRCNHRALDRTFTLEAGQDELVEGVPAGTTCLVTETDKKGAPETRITESPADAAADGQVKVASGAPPASVTFLNVYPGPFPGLVSAGAPRPAAGAAGTGVLGETVSAADPAAALPRTGAGSLLLVAGGLWAVSAGGLLTVTARRRARAGG